MTTPKLFVFSIILALLFVLTAPQKSPLEPEDAISSLRIELEQLKTKVSLLESTIEKSDNKLKSKDDGIKQMENIIRGKSHSIATLQNKIEALQKIEIHMTDEAPQVTEKKLIKAETAATFMKSLKSLVAARWNYSWRPALDALLPKIFLKLSRVRRNGEICIKMLKTEWIPVMKDQCLPLISSLGSHFEPLTAKIIETYHVTENMLLSSTAKIQTTFAPFIQDFPVMKDQWLTFIYSLCSCFESLTAKITEVYRVTKNSLLSYTVKIQTSIAPFIREEYKFAKPYINQFETVTKPYADTDEVNLQPNSGKSAWACRMLVTSIISYHNQVQQWLKTSKLTRSLASIELAWFAATALLCLPVVCLCRFYSAIFRRRGRKLGRTSHPNNNRRKLKRTLSID